MSYSFVFETKHKILCTWTRMYCVITVKVYERDVFLGTACFVSAVLYGMSIFPTSQPNMFCEQVIPTQSLSQRFTGSY